MIREEHITLESVIQLFEKWDENCIVEYTDHGEFDLLIRFVGRDDPYYYCFKDEGCHIIYHRFLPEDYNDLGL